METEEDEILKALEAENLRDLKLISKSSSDTKENTNNALTFLQKKKYSKKTQILKPAVYETEEVTRYIEEKDTDTGCMRYYYPTLKEFKEMNLPCVKRPWIQDINGKEFKGKEVYEDPMLYKPGQIYDYVQKWYVDYFTKKGIESPFAYSENNIFKSPSEICNAKEFTLQPHQKFVGSHMSNMTDFPSMLIYHRLGSGKCQKIDTPIIMFDGTIKKIQDIEVGELLMGPNSKPRKVLSLARGQDMMYEVIPQKGETYTFTSEHVLRLKCNENTFCNIEIKDFIKLSDKMKNQFKLYRVGVEFQHKEIPFDPYDTGLWIGDIHRNKYQKYIPEVYKINSRYVRLQLLAGLIDANGYLENGCYIKNTQKNEEIIDVIFLARSLGFAAYESTTKFGSKAVIISGNIEEIPCRTLKNIYKQENYEQKEDVLVTSFKVVESGIDDYYGFELDSDHLYLLGDFTVTHNSCSSILIAESNKGTYINDGVFVKRKGSFIPQKKIGKNSNSVINDVCNITVVVPKQTMNQYLDEIRGSLENGEIRSCTGACIYTESNKQDDENYIYMRQLYAGKVDKETKKPVSSNLQKLHEIDNEIAKLDNSIFSYNKKDRESTNSLKKKEIQNQLNILNNNRSNYISQREKLIQDINKNVDKVYFLITHDTFLNRITTKVQNNHIASNYILGLETKKNEKLPHPDCFHSDKAVLIIDEVQKITREGGINYFRLYDTLMINARDKISGLPRMKTILLTATPIFDNPHEASLMLNFQRPRIPFPLSRLVFEDFFMDKEDKDNCKIKNKLCYQYLFSGYVSFSQGANPKGFPFRRNNIVLHNMSTEQMDGYVQALCYDIEKDAEDKYEEKNKTNFFDIAYRNQLDDNQQGRYLWSRQLCNIYLPTDLNKTRGNKLKDVKEAKEELKAKEELDRLINTLKQKQVNEILSSYEHYSPKFHYILKKIIESSEKDEGPIIVYCEWIWYGILAMTRVLELLGWKFLDSHDIENEKKHKKFGIWSSSALGIMGIRDESAYTSNLLKVINHKNNSGGNLCKVIFTTVTEGISLKRVSQMHITSPWWNDSREEQISGRAIRFCSHSDLDISRQYVDVYYHCSVLPSFSDYPKINKHIDNKIINIVYKASPIKPAELNFKDLARLTIEQKVFITARRKNDINNQFEKALKETAVDFQLNKFGNLLRFEEIINPSLRIKNYEKIEQWAEIKNNERILYSRSENKYYYYNISTKNLNNMEMVKKESDGGMPVWPNLKGLIKERINASTNWDKHEILHQTDQNNKTMVSFIVTENLEPFNNNPLIRDKNFKELMDYAINDANEDKNVWDYCETQRVKNKMFGILVALYRLSEGAGSALLLENFNDRILSGGGKFSETKTKILQGIASRDLTKELIIKTDRISDKMVDSKSRKNLLELKERLIKVADKIPHKEPLDSTKIKKIEKRLNSLFFTTNEGDVEKMKDKLVSVYHISREYLDGLSPAEITASFDEYVIEERNRPK